MLSKRIKNLREKSGLSQQKLADMLGVTQQAVAKWEGDKAEPDTSMLVKISNIFNVSLDYLLCKTNVKNYDIIETIAAHRSDDPMSELPEEARKSLEDFKQFILRKYSKGRE